MLSPRSWGWTASVDELVKGWMVVPTLVGVDRTDAARDASQVALSPRSWGWTATGPELACPEAVVPTLVGVDRSGPFPSRRVSALSPRLWGWTAPQVSIGPGGRVVPTLVGVDPGGRLRRRWVRRCPHARGGGPNHVPAGSKPPDVVPTLVGVDRSCRPGSAAQTSLSPRSWGWTDLGDQLASLARVVPTLAGVDRATCAQRSLRCCCPHARGGGPQHETRLAPYVPLSPRSWGWTALSRPTRDEQGVVPTLVGVDRQSRHAELRNPRCPHARGGGPYRVHTRHKRPWLSPRSWGWTALAASKRGPPSLSPRSWGWTNFWARSVAVCHVVPTLVGVDRSYRFWLQVASSCPHARGGGPLAPPI